MHLNPQKSRKAHTEIEGSVAALRIVPSCSSVAPGATCATPSQRPVQGEDAGQPFPLAPHGVVGSPLFGRPRRLVSPMSPTTVERHYARRSQKLLDVLVLCAVALLIGFWLAVGHS